MKTDLLLLSDMISRRIRALIFSTLTRKKFKLIGSGFRFFGKNYIDIDPVASFGRNCWIQAIDEYKGTKYQPRIIMGRNLSCSDNVHVSCVDNIVFGSGVLVGSNVYIGDHSHGSARLTEHSSQIPPAMRPLDDVAPIVIGDNVWISDGVVILAGTQIASGSIIGAHSLVKGNFNEPGVIVGAPARLVRKIPYDC